MFIKELIEKRNRLVDQLDAIVKAAEAETRAMTEDENKDFDSITAEIRSIDETIAKLRANEDMGKIVEKTPGQKSAEETESRAFSAFIRGNLEELRDGGMTKTDNGVVIPKTIASKIIETLKEICPIYAMASKFNVKGDLVFPSYDDTTGPVATYAEEFTALTSKSGSFKGITLTGYLVGALTKVSVSLINNVNFNLSGYVVTKIAEAMAEFLEKELLAGTNGKMTGLASCSQGIVAATTSVITVDELIDLQSAVQQRFQKDAAWIMSNGTFKAIRKLKNADGEYLLNRDLANGFGWTLLGRPVYASDAMPEMEAGKAVIYYGDFSGLYVKIAEGISVQVLKERYADEHVYGVIAWGEFDSKIVEEQKVAKLTMHE